MNTITREQVESYGVDFDEILCDYEEVILGDHIKSDIFERETVVQITAENYPELPEEFHGYWRTEPYRYSMENGRIDGPINELHRVKKAQVTYSVWVHDYI